MRKLVLFLFVLSFNLNARSSKRENIELQCLYIYNVGVGIEPIAYHTEVQGSNSTISGCPLSILSSQAGMEKDVIPLRSVDSHYSGRPCRYVVKSRSGILESYNCVSVR